VRVTTIARIFKMMAIRDDGRKKELFQGEGWGGLMPLPLPPELNSKCQEMPIKGPPVISNGYPSNTDLISVHLGPDAVAADTK
jgi:hypothetical protein